MEMLLINHPARLPHLRQGRRVPAAEPGACPTAAASPGSTGRSAPSPSRSRCRRRSCSTASGASPAPAARGSRPRSPATRSSSCVERGADAAGRHRRGPAVQLLLLRQHRADLPGRRTHRNGVPVPLPSLRPRLVADRRASTAPPGARLRTDHRRGTVLRRLAVDDPAVNEEWNCDKGRWAFPYASQGDRITAPLVRDADGALVPTSWPDALDVAARGLAAARSAGGVGVLVGRPLDRRGRLRLRQAGPSSSSAPTTSTSGPGRTRPRRPQFLGVLRRRSRPRRRARRPTPTSRPHQSCSSPASSPRRSRRSSSCGCARRLGPR